MAETRIVVILKPTGPQLVRAPEREVLGGLAKGADTGDYRDRLDRF